MRITRPRLTGLWREPNFVRFISAQSISTFGDQITTLALPLLAVITLEATAGEMSILTAAITSPILVIGLFAGVWVDRLRRRPILIIADFARFAVILAIPIAWWLDWLSIPLLVLLGVLAGTFSVFFEVARQSFVPTLVGRHRLLAANQRIAISESAFSLVGPGVAGSLVGILGAPVTMLIDAVSFLFSGILIRRIDVDEPAPSVKEGPKPGMFLEIKEGLRFVVHSPILRTLAISVGGGNIFANARQAMFILFLSREIGLSAQVIGIVFFFGAAGMLVGSLLPEKVAARIGIGPAIVAGALVLWIGELLFPLAAGSWGLPLVIVGSFIEGLGVPTYDVNQFSLRQATIPHHLLGRVSATMRVIIRGAVPIGALIGGVIATQFDIRAVLWFSAISGPFMAATVWFSPIRAMKTAPTPAD